MSDPPRAGAPEPSSRAGLDEPTVPSSPSIPPPPPLGEVEVVREAEPYLFIPPPPPLGAAELVREARLWIQRWRWYERNSLPWNRARIHWELLRRGAFARWPIEGNVLEALREGRLEVGEGVLFEPHVWITAPAGARVRIGEGTFLNQGVMVASQELVEIGAHCMLANGCFVSDASHRYDDPERPVPWQGFTSRGPTRIGANCWLGAHVVVTDGVTIGERCVIGANSVVTRDLPPRSIAAGAPARVLRQVEYGH